MLQIVMDSAMERKLKKLYGKHYNLTQFYEIVKLLSCSLQLPAKAKDHALSGNWQGYRECHIEPDWLLIYRTTETELILVTTGSHDEIFR